MSLPFIIWTLQRTGGTSLTDLLMKMSEYKTIDHEPFWPARAFGHVTQQWKKTRDPVALDAAMAEIFSQRYLIKHCYEFHGEPLNRALAKAAAAADYRHILLLRKNELARLVSMALAEAHGTWFRKWARKVYADVATGRRSLEPLAVDRLVKHYKTCARETSAVRSLLATHDVQLLEISYEDLYKGPRNAREAHLVQLFEFLGFEAETVKLHQTDIEEKIFGGGQDTHQVFRYIPNLGELKAALRGCGYQYDDEAEEETEGSQAAQEEPTEIGFDDGSADQQRPYQGPMPRWPRAGNQDDAETIHRQGYKSFVGGAQVWDALGRLQVDFLRSQALQPTDLFVDVGCGALRGGQRLIKYLEKGNYFGMDKHIELIIYGVANELGTTLFRQKMPRFVISDCFEFDKFGVTFTCGIAQSLFTHLAHSEICLCLRKLYQVSGDECRFFATFFESETPVVNPATSHSAKGFRFTRSEMEAFGVGSGWQSTYIGDWGHPRGQRMMLYSKAAATR